MPPILKPARRRNGDVTAPELPRTLTTPAINLPTLTDCDGRRQEVALTWFTHLVGFLATVQSGR